MPRARALLLGAVALCAALLPCCSAGSATNSLREQASDAPLDGAAAASAGCVKSSTPVVLVDPPCPTEVSAWQVCPFEQVRLTPGIFDEEDGQWWMSVSFATLNETAAGALPVVRMAKVEGALEGGGEEGKAYCVLRFTGKTTDYRYVSAGGPYFSKDTQYYASPLIHHTDIGPLEPATEYFYQVGRTAVAGAPELYRDTVFRFRTPPAPGAAPAAADKRWEAGSTKTGETMTLVVIGDIGQTQNSNQTACTVKDRWKSDPTVAAGLIIGDMAYADGDGNRWDTWGRLMEQTFSQLPLLVLPGNHEIDFDAETSMPFGPYRHRFRMPSQLPEKIAPLLGGDFLYEGGSSYYSFSVGLLHVVMLNNYNTHGAFLDVNTDPQRLFLEGDLAKVDRNKTPFVIVCMHNPIYNSNMGHHHEPTTKMLQKWAEPIFIQYGVDAVFAGHVHAYERNMGIEFGKPSATGPTYITVGNGGNHEGLYDEWLPKPPYSVFRDGRFYGHGELKVYNHSHLKWTWTPNHEQGDNLPKDEVWLRPRPDAATLLAQQQQAHAVAAPAGGTAMRLSAMVWPLGALTAVAGVGAAGFAWRKYYAPYSAVREPLLP
jgi:hypothetical protein